MHICCAPDASVGYERLSRIGKVLGVFYNPNIEPIDEYSLRESEAQRLAGIMGVDYIEESPDRYAWLEVVAGFENEPERGERCRRCIGHNLKRVALKAQELKIPAIATTLTASPHKDVEFIHVRGQAIAEDHGLEYINETLRKNHGFMRSIELSRRFGLYRQNYCGCRWSKKVDKLAS